MRSTFHYRTVYATLRLCFSCSVGLCCSPCYLTFYGSTLEYPGIQPDTFRHSCHPLNFNFKMYRDSIHPSSYAYCKHVYISIKLPIKFLRILLYRLNYIYSCRNIFHSIYSAIFILGNGWRLRSLLQVFLTMKGDPIKGHAIFLLIIS